MPLLITEKDIDAMHRLGHVTMADYVAGVEGVYRELALGTGESLPRVNFWMEEPSKHDRVRSLKIGAGVLRHRRYLGSLAYTAGFKPLGLNLWFFLFSGETGQTLAFLHGTVLSLWKTGAVGALAAKHMARPNAKIVGFIGTGRFARTQLLGLAAVFDLEEVRLYSRTAEHREAFAQWARDAFPGLKVSIVQHAREAVEAVDILVTITTSSEPVCSGTWLSPGTHVNCVGAHYASAREVDTEMIKRCRVIVDDRAQAFQEKGEILIPLRSGEITADHIVGELGEVVVGKRQARLSDTDCTLFSCGGVPLEYLGTCSMLYERAHEYGFGAPIPE